MTRIVREIAGALLRIAGALRRIAGALRRIVGAPDYSAYLAHMRTRHPDIAPMSPAEFERQRLAARYERPGARCC